MYNSLLRGLFYYYFSPWKTTLEMLKPFMSCQKRKITHHLLTHCVLTEKRGEVGERFLKGRYIKV